MFETVLVADRGVLTSRVVRTCQRLGARTVSVHSAADAHSPHATAADESLLLGDADPASSYLDGRKVLDAAGQCAAQALHPGGGALATSAAFARSVTDAGLTWLGPPVEVLEALAAQPPAPSRPDRRVVVHLVVTADGRADVVAEVEHTGGSVECPAPVGEAEREGLHAAAGRAAAGLGGPGTVAVELARGGGPGPTVLAVTAGLHLDHAAVALAHGVDLTEQQVRLAAGQEAPPVLAQRQGVAAGAALRAAGPGPLLRWEPPDDDDVHVEPGFAQGEQVTPYDDLVALLVARGADSATARAALARARASCVVEGVALAPDAAGARP